VEAVSEEEKAGRPLAPLVELTPGGPRLGAPHHENGHTAGERKPENPAE